VNIHIYTHKTVIEYDSGLKEEYFPDEILVEVREADSGCYIEKPLTICELVNKAGYI
jgi:hypothetical protein